MAMKHFFFLWAVVLFASHSDLRAADMVTLIVPPGEGTRYSEPIVLETGDWARVEYNGYLDPNGAPALDVQIGTFTFEVPATSVPARGDNGVPVIAGPATIRAKVPFTVNTPFLVTLAVQRAGSNANGVPLNSAVIPEDADGQYQVLLESSTDLITWTSAMPGSYGGSTLKRFFRTRIVKVP
jgi:hypothetical protein